MAKKNKFRDYIDSQGITLHRWTINVGLHPQSIYPFYKGIRNPKRMLALRIVKASQGALTLEDLGIID